MVKKVNFLYNKARFIKATAQIIVGKHHCKVPETMEELDALPEVARKTANVVLGGAFNKSEGIVVDTHVMKLSTELGLTDQKDPVKIEQGPMKIVLREHWIDFPHLRILYGREYAPVRPKRGIVDMLDDLYISS